MASSGSLVRIPYRSASVLPKTIPPLNLFRMLAHSPTTLPHILSLGTACFRDTSLSPYQRELLCLLTAKRAGCDYQWEQHLGPGRTAGITEDQISAIAAGDFCGSMWTAQDAALLGLLDASFENSQVVSNTIFAKAKEFFSDQVLVELLVVQGFHCSMARIINVFQVDPEQSSKS
ncbi:AhpD-like protein [Halenospora varia]|nr:AhpD-like protein [Halenospora varia]